MAHVDFRCSDGRSSDRDSKENDGCEISDDPRARRTSGTRSSRDARPASACRRRHADRGDVDVRPRRCHVGGVVDVHDCAGGRSRLVRRDDGHGRRSASHCADTDHRQPLVSASSPWTAHVGRGVGCIATAHQTNESNSARDPGSRTGERHGHDLGLCIADQGDIVSVSHRLGRNGRPRLPRPIKRR